MKKLRQLSIALSLALVFSLPAVAGEISCGTQGEMDTPREGYIPNDEGHIPNNDGLIPNNEGYMPNGEGLMPNGNEGWTEFAMSLMHTALSLS